jgi:phosphatidylinositol alpha-1,6-mannosyltransferase
MKLLLISSEFPPGPGGIGHHAYSLSSALIRKGHEVVVLTVTDFVTTEQVKSFDSAHDFKIIRFPRIGWKTYLNRILMTDRTVRAGQFDQILLTGKFSLWLGLYIKWRFKALKTIAIIHGSEVNPEGRWVRMLTHHAIEKSDKIVSVSRFTTSLLPEKIRIKKTIDIIPNGIDTELLSSYPGDTTLKLTGSPRLLTVGHVSPRKGQHRVIASLPKLRTLFPNLHYHIVGRPITQSRLEELAKRLGVDDMITFHGIAATHQSLAAFYQNTDVFMLLSENQPNGDVEGFGIVALEANYFGMPVVGALHCGVEDAVDNRNTGILADGNDITAVCEAVRICVGQHDSMSINARAWANKHDWNEIVDQFQEVLK